MKKETKENIAWILSPVIIALAIWLTYYPFYLMNKLGLIMRGPILNELPQHADSIDMWMNRTSSLGILFFICFWAMFFIWADSYTDKK